MHFASEMSKHAKLVYFEPHSYFACPISWLDVRLPHYVAQINLTSREVLWTIIPRKSPAQILPRVAWHVFYLSPTSAKPFRWFNNVFPRERFLWKVHHKSSDFTKTHNRSVKQKETQQFLSRSVLCDVAISAFKHVGLIECTMPNLPWRGCSILDFRV